MNPADNAAAEALEALARIPGTAGVQVIDLLADGTTNRSYLVASEGQRWVLRLDKPEVAALGLDRDNEFLVLETVAAAGLAPAYRYIDSATGVCLRPFVAGHSLSPDDLAEPDMLAELAGMLRRLHRLAPVGRVFDPVAAAHRYANQLGTGEARRLARRAESILADAGPGPDPPALCHNDLVSQNVLRTAGNGLLLIDWEFAGIGDPYFDLAVVIRHHSLGEDHSRHLLASYLRSEPARNDRQHLERQCEFYGRLLELWNQRVSA